MSADQDNAAYLKSGPLVWSFILAGLGLLIAAAYPSLVNMIQRWEGSEEYGYGFMIPFIAAFLIWQRKDRLDRIDFSGSWLGVLILSGRAARFICRKAQYAAFGYPIRVSDFTHGGRLEPHGLESVPGNSGSAVTVVSDGSVTALPVQQPVLAIAACSPRSSASG